MTLAEAYAAKVMAGELKNDAAQAAVVEKFELLAAQLGGKTNGVLSKWFGKAANAPRSLYIHGEVGRGKTMLMDLFFETVEVSSKRRIHFHPFMQEVHQRRAKTTAANVIQLIARDISAEARLLCLDEMQVTDIADAMILGRLFEALLANGTVIVTTSNLPPDGLYRDGLNRNLFLPAIAMMQEKFDIVSLASDRDYRLGRLKGRDTFITPLGAAATVAQQRIWQDLTETERGEPLEITVLGRTLHVPEAGRSLEFAYERASVPVASVMTVTATAPPRASPSSSGRRLSSRDKPQATKRSRSAPRRARSWRQGCCHKPAHRSETAAMTGTAGRRRWRARPRCRT